MSRVGFETPRCVASGLRGGPPSGVRARGRARLPSQARQTLKGPPGFPGVTPVPQGGGTHPQGCMDTPPIPPQPGALCPPHRDTPTPSLRLAGVVGT